MAEHTFAIPAYKQSPYLEQCLISLKCQTVPVEIILTTSTPSAFLQDLATKHGIAYHVNYDRGGTIGSDWNFALSKANTSLVTLAHQDDIYDRNYAKKVLDTYTQRQHEVLLLFSDYADLIDGTIRYRSRNAWIKKILLIPYAFNSMLSSVWLKKLTLAMGDPMCCPSITLNKKMLPDFKFDESYTCALDWEAWYRLAAIKGYFVFIAERLLLHRIHAGSETTVQLTNGKRLVEEEAILRKIWGRCIGKFWARLYRLGHRDNEI